MSLDVNNEDQWTEDSLPRMDVVKQLVGNQFLTRESVNTAIPGFSRSTHFQQQKTKAIETTALQVVETTVSTTDQDFSEIEQAKRELEIAVQKKNDADRKMKIASEVLDALIVQNQIDSPKNVISDIQAYLQGQKKVLEDRKVKIEQMKGVDIKQFIAQRCPLDMAMSRKNLRGSQRPFKQ